MCTMTHQILLLQGVLDVERDHNGRPTFVQNELLEEGVLGAGLRFYTQDALLRHRYLAGRLYVVEQAADGHCHLGYSGQVAHTNVVRDIKDVSAREEEAVVWLAHQLYGKPVDGVSEWPLYELGIGHKAITNSQSEYLLALPLFAEGATDYRQVASKLLWAM